MEFQILAWCVAAPTILSLASIVLAWLASRSTRTGIRQRLPAVIAIVGWCLASVTVLIARQELDWTALEAWQQILVPIAITSLALALLNVDGESSDGLPWVLAGLGCIALSMTAMPGGEGWTDTFSSHRYWMAAVSSAGLINVWSLNRLIHRGGETWASVVALAGLGGPIMLAATAYGGLAEWLGGAATATMVFSIAAIILKSKPLAVVAYPSTMLTAAATASGRFYTYEEHPFWLYAILLTSPALIALPDHWLRHRETWIRVTVAAMVALILLGIIGWLLLGDSWTGGSADENW